MVTLNEMELENVAGGFEFATLAVILVCLIGSVVAGFADAGCC